ncbi:hypothetical protein K501DRAFT_278566 [Backusella circina FSU 941]|nr:hypothetical protein K501DRAFT_280781 [Backusella circina FSU 941]KAI8877338.1 hypothetical protein K501DRAFT_278566 [Backusella circina FSU 941]
MASDAITIVIRILMMAYSSRDFKTYTSTKQVSIYSSPPNCQQRIANIRPISLSLSSLAQDSFRDPLFYIFTHVHHAALCGTKRNKSVRSLQWVGITEDIDSNYILQKVLYFMQI